MINLRKTLTDAHTALATEGIAHALIGGFALAVYGYHRTTSDIDLLADGTQKDLIKRTLSAKGYKIQFESPEVLQFTGPGFIDILLANRPLSQEMLKRAQPNSALGVYVLKAEDIIGLKIQAYKNDASRELQDKADIQKLLALPNLEMDMIKKYADLFGEWSVIEKLRGSKP
ncbi:nucleotidyltransferase domain-containing protein [Bdellovibrio sp. HCB-110]|uniref:nucleotidyltransferase domain-containing protein n=1 Tax=Bdellovibrio sp. HCB-110 TaxID=3391182 RepID=UPI0039B656F2